MVTWLVDHRPQTHLVKCCQHPSGSGASPANSSSRRFFRIRWRRSGDDADDPGDWPSINGSLVDRLSIKARLIHLYCVRPLACSGFAIPLKVQQQETFSPYRFFFSMHAYIVARCFGYGYIESSNHGAYDNSYYYNRPVDRRQGYYAVTNMHRFHAPRSSARNSDCARILRMYVLHEYCAHSSTTTNRTTNFLLL